MKINLDQYCNGDKNTEFCVRIRSPNGRIWGISKPLTTQNLLNNVSGQIPLFETTSFKKAFGALLIVKARVYERPSFTDYLRSGWQIALSVAIDFTESNLDPRDPKSLHNIDPQKN